MNFPGVRARAERLFYDSESTENGGYRTPVTPVFEARGRFSGFGVPRRLADPLQNLGGSRVFPLCNFFPRSDFTSGVFKKGSRMEAGVGFPASRRVRCALVSVPPSFFVFWGLPKTLLVFEARAPFRLGADGEG